VKLGCSLACAVTNRSTDSARALELQSVKREERTRWANMRVTSVSTLATLVNRQEMLASRRARLVSTLAMLGNMRVCRSEQKVYDMVEDPETGR
jgi:hypothetical protein